MSRRTSRCSTKALQQINYPLDFILAAANHYDQNLIKDGGSAIHNIYMVVGFVPYEDASKNPPTQQYLDLFAKYKPSGKSHAALGLQTWSAWLLFAEAAKKCGDNLTRKCVYDNALTFTDWTGGGLNAPQNVKDQTAGDCGILLEATPDGFRRAAGLRRPTAASSTATRRTSSRCTATTASTARA